MKKQKNKIKYILGIDEVGRGPLCGPVTVAGTCISFEDKSEIKTFCKLNKITDSKQVSEKDREEIDKLIKKNKKINLASSSVSAKVIDKIGIRKSLNLAISRILKKFSKDLNKNPEDFLVLLDGSLWAPENYINQKTIIKGDQKEFLISAASIFAKVKRDKYMVNLSKKYPNYFLDQHKGYGTKKHREAILKYGLCDQHRESFCRNILQKQ